MPVVTVGSSTVTYEDFDCFGETRQRVKRIEAPVVRRRKSVVRDCTIRPRCLRAGNGDYDRYPDHTEGGHLIGLSIGGEDHTLNLVPMFGGFNQVTWKAFETSVYNDPSITDIKVSLSYTAADPRKPAQFYMYVRRNGGAWTLFAYPHMMDHPRPAVFAIPMGAVNILNQAALDMVTDGWTPEGAGMDHRGLPVATDRLYAALDYLLFTDLAEFKNLVALLGLTWSGFNIQRGRGFTELQREILLRVNYIRHNNTLRSDDDGLVLLPGSTTHGPQIDHQISMRGGSGYNAFSNAMVLGALQNRSKGTKRKRGN